MRKALIVGINDYPFGQLNGCENDAIEIDKLLKRNGNGTPNFSTQKLLSNDVRTKKALRSYIENLFHGDPAVALLYFSGHGYIDLHDGYLVTPDADKYDEGVSMTQILSIANHSNAKDKIIILDCCHAGTFGSPKTSGSTTTQIDDGIVILTASKDDEPAIEINGHGLFTNLLIQALNGGAADFKGDITAGSIYSYIDQTLGSWYTQRPVFKTNVSRFTPIRTVIPQVSTEILRKIIDYFPQYDDKFYLNPSFEDTNSKDVEHLVIEPYAKPENVAIFKDLQKFQSIGLVVPVDAEFMYFAAIESKSCRLTELGRHYWKLVNEGKI